MPVSSRFSRSVALPIALASVLVSTVLPAPALAAIPPGSPEWWSRLDQLIDRQAYPAAETEITRAEAAPHFAEHHGDRASYWLGYALRRDRHIPEAEAAFRRVPAESHWYFSAIAELAALKRDGGKDSEAIALYENLLRLAPDERKPEFRSPLADLYFTTGQYPKALVQYREMASGDGPARERALFAWGWSLARVNEEDAAINVWKQGLEQYPTSRYAQAVRLALGNLLLARGDHLQASTYYNEAARQGSDVALMARAELLAGEAYADGKDWGLALSHYRAVSPDSPLREPAAYGEAFCLWQQGKLPEARQAFQDWLQRYPEGAYRAAATYALAEIARAQGNAADAARDYQRVAELAPKSQWAEEAGYRGTQLAFEGHDFAKSVVAGHKFEDGFPRSRFLGPVLWMRGESYLALSNYQGAITAYSQLAVLGNHDFLQGAGGAVDFKIGMAHFYGGNYAEAARVLETVTDGPMQTDALFWQAEARYRLGQYDASRTLYARLIGATPNDARVPEAYYGLGWSCYRLGDFAAAKSGFSEAIKRLPAGSSQQDATYHLALTEIELKDYDGGRTTLTHLLEANPDADTTAKARFQISWSYYRQDRLEDAANAFGQFVAADPQSPLAPQALIWRGRSLFRLHRYDDAIQVLNLAVAHPLATPNQVYDAREQLAAAYHNAGQFDQAREVYQKLLSTPNLSGDRQDELHEGVVQAYLKAGKLLEARAEILKKPTISEQDKADLMTIAEGFFGKSAWDEVLTTYNAMPEPPARLTYWAGKASLEKHDLAGAGKLLGSLRDCKDDEIRALALYDLAHVQQGQGDLKNARQTLIQLAEAYPKRAIAPTALIEAASVSQSLKDWGGAQTLYRRVAENKAFPLDERRQAWMGLGDMRRMQKQWGQALLAYRGARGLGPQGSLGAALGGYWAGSVLVEMKQFREAVHELTTLKFPANAEPLPSLVGLKQGEALERLNRWREALAIYAHLAKSAPDTERAEAKSRYDWIEKNVPKEMRS